MKMLKFGTLLACLFTSTAYGMDFGHLTIFGEVAHSDVVGDSVRSEADIQPTISADILYSFDYERFSLLAEYYLSEDDSELERLEFGLRLNSWSSIKAGLLHNPAEYWLNEYHQGSYSQTSITKPFQSLIGFPGGVTNTHLSGVQWLTEFTLPNDRTLNFDYTVAASPDLSIDEPEVHVGDYVKSGNDLSLNIAHIRFKPFALNDSSVGLSYTEGDVGFDQKTLTTLLGPLGSLLLTGHVAQSTTNTYFNLEMGSWRLIASHLDERIELVSDNPLVSIFISNDRSLRFQLNYLHLEKSFQDKLLVFGRHEKARPHDNITGLTQLTAPILDFDLNYEKLIVGARWDLANRQAITIQYSDHTTPSNKQNMMHLSWSFVWDVGL